MNKSTQTQPMDENSEPQCKCAKLIWNAGQWWVRYPGPNDECLRLALLSQSYDDAFEEANKKLNHDPNVEWIIA